MSKEIPAAVKTGALLVDVRSPEEYNAGSMKEAINISLNTLEKELEPFNNAKTVVAGGN